MSVTTITVQKILRTGLSPVLAAANADGSYVANNGRVFIDLRNTNAAARNITIATPGAVDGLAVADRTVNIAIGSVTPQEKMIGPFPPEIYGSTLTLTYDAVPDLTIAALQL